MRRIACAAFIATAGAALLSAAPPPRSTSLQAAGCDVRDGRVLVPAGTVLLGEDGEGRPGRKVAVAAFWIDRHEVTNRQFAAFVAATGYRTAAEREGGSAIFVPPAGPVDLNNAASWWRYRKGADWRHPDGAGSSIEGREDWPVIHVDHEDAAAYARWASAALPDEAQWERAARDDQAASRPPASWAYDDEGHPTANSWQGVFPVRDTGRDGYAGLAPVGCFKGNSFGLHDMVGNVWEWTSEQRGRSGLVKGGSYLCAMNYCANFRPAAFQAQELDLGTSHIGFRTISAAGGSPARR
nr:SUMF1/EgtB/PvdO family nonheme iron enzyme [Sphingobium bisphenolivorans]